MSAPVDIATYLTAAGPAVQACETALGTLIAAVRHVPDRGEDLDARDAAAVRREAQRLRQAAARLRQLPRPPRSGERLAPLLTTVADEYFLATDAVLRFLDILTRRGAEGVPQATARAERCLAHLRANVAAQLQVQAELARLEAVVDAYRRTLERG